MQKNSMRKGNGMASDLVEIQILSFISSVTLNRSSTFLNLLPVLQNGDNNFSYIFWFGINETILIIVVVTIY